MSHFTTTKFTFCDGPHSGVCFYLNKSTSYLSLCLSLNSFSDEISRTCASLFRKPGTVGFAWVRVPSLWVPVPSWGKQFHYHFIGASPLPLDMGYLFLVGSNIILLMVVQQLVVILVFSQKMSTRSSTPSSNCSPAFLEHKASHSCFQPELPSGRVEGQ